MHNQWLALALWIGLALLSSVISIRFAISVALVEIIVGMLAGAVMHLEPTAWTDLLASVGAVILTFLAGAEIDPGSMKGQLGASLIIGASSFIVPFGGVMLFTHYVAGWPWPQAEIAGISLSTTSVAVVYSVMVETGLSKSATGKTILAACFVTDLGTVLALGVLFAKWNFQLPIFALAVTLAMVSAPRMASPLFKWAQNRISEPEVKFTMLVLFLLAGLASTASVEPVLPAYLLGISFAPLFSRERSLAHRIRIISFALLTPFYFLKAGILLSIPAILAAAGPIALLLLLKVGTKFAGVLPATRAYRFSSQSGIYTALLMSTGLTFGSIAALFGLTNNIIDRDQYSLLVTAVLLSALIPTVVAQRWFSPALNNCHSEDPNEPEKDTRRT